MKAKWELKLVNEIAVEKENICPISPDIQVVSTVPEDG